jgi:RNA recognition motif-containing protein
MSKVYVGNLHYDVQEEELRQAFSKFGRVTSLTMKQGFAFLEYAEERAAEVCEFG